MSKAVGTNHGATGDRTSSITLVLGTMGTKLATVFVPTPLYISDHVFGRPRVLGAVRGLGTAKGRNGSIRPSLNSVPSLGNPIRRPHTPAPPSGGQDNADRLVTVAERIADPLADPQNAGENAVFCGTVATDVARNVGKQPDFTTKGG